MLCRKHCLSQSEGGKSPASQWLDIPALWRFPALWEVWRGTNVAQTGCNLSKFFESALLRTPEFYNFAESLPGVKVLDCHDGLSIFAAEDDKDAEAKAEKIRDFLVNLTVNKFAIRPVIKVEPVVRPNYSRN